MTVLQYQYQDQYQYHKTNTNALIPISIPIPWQFFNTNTKTNTISDRYLNTSFRIVYPQAQMGEHHGNCSAKVRVMRVPRRWLKQNDNLLHEIMTRFLFAEYGMTASPVFNNSASVDLSTI